MNGNYDTGWIEMVLPIEQLNLGCIQLEAPKRLRSAETDVRYERLILPLAYETPLYRLPCLAVLTPFMKVHSWDSSTGRLEFELERDSLVYRYITAFEQKLIHLLVENSKWLGYSTHDIQSHVQQNLQYAIHDCIFTVYLHGQNVSTKPMGRVWGWKQGLWAKGATPSSFKKGQQLRVALRFQGICFFPNAPAKSKYRIQHQTIAVYYKDT
jgi:hypothetical protein